jgi:hypothetical protein
MTISQPSRFQKNEKSIVNFIRGFGFRAVLACVVCASPIAIYSHPASAMCVIQGGGEDCDAAPGDPWASFEVQCDDECAYHWFKVDPNGRGVSRFLLKLKFDTKKYTFDASRSGPLCDFANPPTPCLPPRPSLGTGPVLRKDLPPRGGFQMAPSSVTERVTKTLIGPDSSLSAILYQRR